MVSGTRKKFSFLPYLFSVDELHKLSAPELVSEIKARLELPDDHDIVINSVWRWRQHYLKSKNKIQQARQEKKPENIFAAGEETEKYKFANPSDYKRTEGSTIKIVKN